MALANTALRISELDFDSIRSNLKTYLSAQNEFTDFDFEGSGLAVLLDLLAYNTHYMAYYLNMVGNEMFLDTAQLRPSVISHAKHIDYVPKSQLGAAAVINLQVTPSGGEDTDATTLTMAKNTRFISEPVDGVNYIFSTIAANTITKVGGSFSFVNIPIRQGDPVSQSYTVAGQKKFNIPSANADTSVLTVTVQESASNTLTKVYTEADDITELTANSLSYFLEENADANGSYSIYFGDGTIGKKPANNNIVILNYIETSGEAANKANTFTPIQSIGGEYSGNVIVTSVSSATSGAPKESIETIRDRAPHFYTAQNRAVTTNDYKSLLLRDYPNIEAISVWSGDQNDPPIYGKVFISMKPKENYILSEKEKLRIETEVIANRSVMTVFPEIVDPDYTYIIIEATVNYSTSKTTLSADALKSLVRQAILDYRDADLKTFTSTFRVSTLQKYIDNAHESILGSTVDILLQKRVELTLNTPLNYRTSYQYDLHGGYAHGKLGSYPSITILDGSGTSRVSYIEDTPDSVTGISEIQTILAGTGYTSVPTVTIEGDGTGASATAVIVGGKIKNITLDARGQDYTVATATLSGGGGSGASISPVLQSRIGTLRSFYYKSNGEKVILNPNLGTIDYDSGDISIILLNPTGVTENDRYDTNFLTLNAEPHDKLLCPVRNGILDIDDADGGAITIELVPEA
jgi:hypothetical protein